MIQLYAFVRGLDELPDDLEAVPLGSSAAVVGPAGGDERDDLVRHGLLLQSLVDSADAVLPARFGERFADTASLGAALAGRTEALEERLAAVEGCVELTVRVARAGGRAAHEAADGGAYMRSRLRAVAADSAVAHDLHALLAARSRDAVVADPGLSRLVHDACYLIARDDVDEFAETVERYAAAHPELSLVCTGPWAPASFAGAA